MPHSHISSDEQYTEFVLKSWKVKDSLMSQLFGTSALSPTVLWLIHMFGNNPDIRGLHCDVSCM